MTSQGEVKTCGDMWGTVFWVCTDGLYMHLITNTMMLQVHPGSVFPGYLHRKVLSWWVDDCGSVHPPSAIVHPQAHCGMRQELHRCHVRSTNHPTKVPFVCRVPTHTHTHTCKTPLALLPPANFASTAVSFVGLELLNSDWGSSELGPTGTFG